MKMQKQNLLSSYTNDALTARANHIRKLVAVTGNIPCDLFGGYTEARAIGNYLIELAELLEYERKHRDN